jgi:hypothetical protein
LAHDWRNLLISILVESVHLASTSVEFLAHSFFSVDLALKFDFGCLQMAPKKRTQSDEGSSSEKGENRLI